MITDKEIEELRKYRSQPDDDTIYYKQIIKNKLIRNNKIIYLLNNKELEDAEAENDEYFGENIKPFYIIPEGQSKVNNYICFECSFENVSRQNAIIKFEEIKFYILVEQQNALEELTSCARHDLIAAEIKKDFNGCNDFGTQLKLSSDQAYTTDNNFILRILSFHQEAPNSLTKDGKVINLRSGFR